MSKDEKKLNQDRIEEELKENEPTITVNEQIRATPEVLTEAYKSLGKPLYDIVDVLNDENLFNPDRALLAQMILSFVLTHIGLTGYERVGVIGFVEHDIHAWIDFLKMKHSQGTFEAKFKEELERQLKDRPDNPFPV